MEQTRIDEGAWPLVVIHYPKLIEHQDFMSSLDRIIGFVQRGEPWVMINDARGSGHPNAKQRQAIASMYEAHEQEVRRHWRGSAIVFDSQVIVGVLTALVWLRPPPHPFRAFSDYNEGRSWALDMLAGRTERTLGRTG